MNLKISDLLFGYNIPLIKSPMQVEIEEGTIIAVVGKNGMGKSTLLKTIAGIIPSLSGEVFIDSQRIDNYNISKKISVVLTTKPLSALSVKEVLSLGRIPYTNRFNQLNVKDKQIIERIIKKLNLQSLLNKKINQISDGELQIVMIARALIQDTPIIILDEPTTHLDLDNKAIVLGILKEMKEEGKIIIFSTHDINLVLSRVDLIWVINNKEFQQISKGKEREIVKIFPSKNLIYDEKCKIIRLI